MNPNVGFWVLLVMIHLISLPCVNERHKNATTTMKSGLSKQNKSSPRVMKQDIDMNEITLSSLSFRCLFNAIPLEMG